MKSLESPGGGAHTGWVVGKVGCGKRRGETGLGLTSMQGVFAWVEQQAWGWCEAWDRQMVMLR